MSKLTSGLRDSVGYRRRKGGGSTVAAAMASAAGSRAVAAAKVVKPIISHEMGEAKSRVRELYRAWYREVPNTGVCELRSQC